MSVLLAVVMLGAMGAALAIDLSLRSRRSWPVLVADGLMVLAMLDSCILGDPLLPAWSWAIALLCCLFGTLPGGRSRADGHSLRLHRIGLVLSAGLVAVAGGLHASGHGGAGPAGHAHGGAQLPSPLLGLLGLALLYAIVAFARSAPGAERIRNAASGTGIVAMAGMLALA